ncbi:MAG: hypothetical protein M0Z99_34580 [Betaproteobacteria bacterium]|nr:hypothetical protein [Betaproteobacteria bacterium]
MENKAALILIAAAAERRRIADIGNAARNRASAEAAELHRRKPIENAAALSAFVAEQREVHEKSFLESVESASDFAMRLRETRDFLARSYQPSRGGVLAERINKTTSNWISYIQMRWALYGDEARFSTNYEFGVAKALYAMSPNLEMWALKKIRD